MPRTFSLERKTLLPKITAHFLREIEDRIRDAASSIGNPISTTRLEIEDPEGRETFDTAHDELVSIRLPKSSAIELHLEDADENLTISLQGITSELSIAIETSGPQAREDALRLLDRIKEFCEENTESTHGTDQERFSFGFLQIPSLHLTPDAVRTIKKHLAEKIAIFMNADIGLITTTLDLEHKEGHLVRALSLEELQASRFPSDIQKFSIGASHRELQRMAEAKVEFTSSRSETLLEIEASGSGSESFSLEAYKSLIRAIEPYRSPIGILYPTFRTGYLLGFILFFLAMTIESIEDNIFTIGILKSIAAIIAAYLITFIMLPYTHFDNPRIDQKIRAIKWIVSTIAAIIIGRSITPILNSFF